MWKFHVKLRKNKKREKECKNYTLQVVKTKNLENSHNQQIVKSEQKPASTKWKLAEKQVYWTTNAC